MCLKTATLGIHKYYSRLLLFRNFNHLLKKIYFKECYHASYFVKNCITHKDDGNATVQKKINKLYLLKTVLT